MDGEVLAAKIYERKPIWNKWDKQHANRNVVENLWAKISHWSGCNCLVSGFPLLQCAPSSAGFLRRLEQATGALVTCFLCVSTQTAGKGKEHLFVSVKRETTAQRCSGVHPCACEQQVGKKRKKKGWKKIRKELEVPKEGKWVRKKESRRHRYAGVPGCRKYPTIRWADLN